MSPFGTSGWLSNLSEFFLKIFKKKCTLYQGVYLVFLPNLLASLLCSSYPLPGRSVSLEWSLLLVDGSLLPLISMLFCFLPSCRAPSTILCAVHPSACPLAACFHTSVLLRFLPCVFPRHPCAGCVRAIEDVWLWSSVAGRMCVWPQLLPRALFYQWWLPAWCCLRRSVLFAPTQFWMLETKYRSFSEHIALAIVYVDP